MQQRSVRNARVLPVASCLPLGARLGPGIGIAEGNGMSDVQARSLRLALGGALLISILSAAGTEAQYYPPSRYGYDPGYPPGYRGYGYDRDYIRRDDYYRRRAPGARDLYDDAPPRPRKAKREQFDEPKPDAKIAGDKPLKGPFHIVVSVNSQ